MALVSGIRPRPIRLQEPGVEAHETGWSHESGRPVSTPAKLLWLCSSDTASMSVGFPRPARFSKESLVHAAQLHKLAALQPHFATELQTFEWQT